MISFLMFFYFFVFVYLYVAITNKSNVSIIHIETRDISRCDDKMDIDEIAELDDVDDVDDVDSELDTNCIQSFQVEMKTNKKDERLLYEFHSYLSEHKINEDTIVMTVEDDNILWNIRYSSNVYEKFYNSLIECINDNILSENLVVYLNGEKI